MSDNGEVHGIKNQVLLDMQAVFGKYYNKVCL